MGQIDNKIVPTGFLYKETNSSGQSNRYTIEIHYSNKNKREFIVNSKQGSVSILSNGNLRMQLIKKLVDKGVLDYNSPHTEINVGTLVVRDGELRTLEELQNEQQNNNANNSAVSRTYAISDIHGMLGTYMDAMRKINSNDSLFILGDAADRGKYGIDILLDIMQRQGKNGKKPQVTYMLGNHDAALIQWIEIFNKYNLSIQEIMDFMNESSYTGSLKFLTGVTMRDYQKRGEQIPSRVKAEEAKYKKAIEEIKKKTDVVRKQKGITESEIRTLTIWLNSNGGLPTANRYLQLPKEKQDELYEFLVNSPVFLGKKIGGQNIVFTHAAPPNIVNKKTEDELMISMTFKEMRDKYGLLATIQFLEEREGKTNNKFSDWKKAGFKTICGHDPCYGKIERDTENGYINIDAGCGHTKSNSKLALYCIETGQTEFLDEREDDIRTTPDFDDGAR